MDSKKGYKYYSAIFNLFAKLPMKKKTAVLLSPHMASFTDSLFDVGVELSKRGYRVVRVAGSDIKPKAKTVGALFRMFRFFTIGAYRLATAQLVFLNDNFMPLADLNFRKEAVLTQLWHAEGAFKKFGLGISLEKDIEERVRKGNEKLSFVVCSSKGVSEIYAQAFGVEAEKVLPYGSPRADRYIKSSMDTKESNAVREKLFGKTEKKIILYAPTFRDDPEVNKKLLRHFDFEEFNKRLSDRYLLVLRLHPQIHNGVKVPDNVIDLTSYPSVNDIIKSCDMLITDYSSICMDFALVNKPSVFYAFDLDEYDKDRSFYFEYKKYVPGKIAETFEELLSAVENAESDETARNSFVRFNFDEPDGKSVNRIVDRVILEANSR